MSLTIEEAMRAAVGHHQAGRMAQAETMYRQVLAARPQHAAALHMLGILAGQTGRTEAAIDLMGRSIQADPGVAVYHSNLAEIYRRCGQDEPAIRSFERAIALDPRLAPAHVNLGHALRSSGQNERAAQVYRRALELAPGAVEARLNLGLTLQALGRLDDAIAALARAAALDPTVADLQISLGNVLKARGRHDEAIAAYERAIALEPDSGAAYNNLALVLHETGRNEEAITMLGQAARTNPDKADVQVNLGNVLRCSGRLEEAIAAYRRALALDPHLPEAYNNFGIALHEAGSGDEAIAAFERAIALRPGYAQAFSNKGGALSEQGRFDEAIAALDGAIAHGPNDAAAHNNLAHALWITGRLDAAAAACRRAMALKANYAEAQANLGNVYKDQGRLDEALACYRTAVAMKPTFSRAASNALSLLHYHPDYDAQAILAEHRAWAHHYTAPLAALVAPHRNDCTPGRRLRIGYVSPDFRDHPVGRMLVPLFTHHDRGQFEILVYSDVRQRDAVTERLRSLSHAWLDTVSLDDQRLAERIRDDRVDILVDLALHTAGNRLLVFARKPAPVQVTMLGMPATTGLDTMDYRLTDSYLDPPGTTDANYTERSIRLPHSYWVYPPPGDAPPVSPLPAWTNNFITFGCLNQFFKVTRPALQLWLRVLQALPDARLVLQAQPGSHRDDVTRLFQEGGVGRDRVEFVERATPADYLKRLQRLDLALDPFPYNGHVSTLDALWMGVPVLTLCGRTAVARGGLSLLSNVGLPELVARTPEQLVETAVALAGDLARLARLRAGLRARMSSSPLLDGKQYAAGVEAAFRSMWQNWCRQGAS